MFENFGGKKEKPLNIDPETFKDIYESNLDSAFADNIRSIAAYLNEGEIASQMTQEGAEFDTEYLEILRTIRNYLQSENLECIDLGQVESLAINLISEEAQGTAMNESFLSYQKMIQSGNSKLNGVN